jgi:hypothetical protein
MENNVRPTNTNLLLLVWLCAHRQLRESSMKAWLSVSRSLGRTVSNVSWELTSDSDQLSHFVHDQPIKAALVR